MIKKKTRKGTSSKFSFREQNLLQFYRKKTAQNGFYAKKTRENQESAQVKNSSHIGLHDIIGDKKYNLKKKTEKKWKNRT